MLNSFDRYNKYLKHFHNIETKLTNISDLDYVQSSLKSHQVLSPLCVFILCLAMTLHRAHFLSDIKLSECDYLSDLDLLSKIDATHYTLTDFGDEFVRRYLPHYILIFLFQCIVIGFKRLFWVMVIVSYLFLIYAVVLVWIQMPYKQAVLIFGSLAVIGTSILIAFPFFLVIFFIDLMGSLPMNINLPSAKVTKGDLTSFVWKHHIITKIHNPLLQDMINHNLCESRRASLKFRLTYNWFAIRLCFEFLADAVRGNW